MNTNQSKRKKEFIRKVDEKAFAAYINNLRVSESAKAESFRDQIIGRILRPNNEAITLDYTDNTIHFGEDYQASNSLTK